MLRRGGFIIFLPFIGCAIFIPDRTWARVLTSIPLALSSACVFEKKNLKIFLEIFFSGIYEDTELKITGPYALRYFSIMVISSM